MKISIRLKMLIYMTINVLIFSIVLFGSNIMFTQKLYINYKKDILAENSKKIQNVLENYPDLDFATVEFELNRIEKSIGASLFINTPHGETYYPPYESRGDSQRVNPFFPFGPSPMHDDVKHREIYDENSFFIITEDPNLNFETLRFQTKLENGLNILLWFPTLEISESIGVFNQIVVFTALIILLGSVAWSLFISAKFTKPITQINKTAKKISILDFSETLEVRGSDEIAQLSISINELSNKLHDSINQLNIKNLQLENDIINEKKLEKMRKEFVSSVSHELKTPLFLIQGYAEGLKKINRNEDKRDFYCDVIMNETEKMDKLLKDLLDLAQIEAGMFDVRESVFDITELAEITMNKFQPIFEDKKININLDFQKELNVYADPVRTEQIIVNFVNNAINHLDDRNEIKITIKPVKDKIKLTVFNSGENIPGDIIDKIWDSFYKADESRTREYGGTGLGLSIVRAIQEGHKNGYGAENIDNGVEFWITLDRDSEM